MGIGGAAMGPELTYPRLQDAGAIKNIFLCFSFFLAVGEKRRETGGVRESGVLVVSRRRLCDFALPVATGGGTLRA